MTPTQRAAALRLADALERTRVRDDVPLVAAALLRELLAAETVQDTPPQRPPTPVGLSDTDWLAHLSTMPPIAYALRDTLYCTSKAGVLRFCAADEPGAFAVYTYPPQQRKRLLANDIVTMYAECPTCDADMIDFARAIERAHGITGEQK